MDKNTIIGFSLIFLIILAWQYFMAPSKEEIARKEFVLDSLRQQEERRADSLAQLKNVVVPADSNFLKKADSQKQVPTAQNIGPFQSAAASPECFEVLENEVMRVLLSCKGGRVKEIEIKKYFKVEFDSNHKEIKLPLKLLEDKKDHFDYLLPIAGVPGGVINSKDILFTSQKNGNTITFRADAGNGRYFEQRYSIKEGSYFMDYSVRMEGLEDLFPAGTKSVQLNWITYLDKLEQNTKYERNYSTVYYKERDGDYDYCSCTRSDSEDLEGKDIDWVAHSNQFFSSALISKEKAFSGGKFDTEILDMENEDLKKLHSQIQIPVVGQQAFAMELFAGPKEFKMLRSHGRNLEDIVAFGRSIFGSINRWVIRPIFTFLASFIGSKGIVILMMTFIVKLFLYPLTYKMLRSQSKMAALKPQLAKMKEKFKDDSQKQQMESMKIYREFGVNPLGGCMPMVLQMPIWFALYRFFPGSIEFRQADFLWATDLSSYDAAFWLPTAIPFYGDHVSLFTLLWAGTTVIYTYYNMQHMDMSMQNPMMKYMQYFMPIMFLFFFNNFAAGLTCYLFFSNVFNITQTVVTKNYIINQDKIRAELDANKKKPKKKGGFQARLEKAMKEQQRVQAEKETKGRKGKRK